jgi:tRNA (mo5U34)-methyltransferase
MESMHTNAPLAALQADYALLWEHLARLATCTGNPASPIEPLKLSVEKALQPQANGHWPRWQEAFKKLPDTCAETTDVAAAAVRFGLAEQLNQQQRDDLTEGLHGLHPWRKGPFEFFGTQVDTEWRSDFKWQRIAGAVDWNGVNVLDIGCGNGYFGWRMLGAGATSVMGVDPFLAFVLQYAACKRNHKHALTWVLPAGIEALPRHWPLFDLVCSMGVLYHRRDPVEHLRQISGLTKAGGHALVETLILPGEPEGCLRPADPVLPQACRGRYAKMRNVFAIPGLQTLKAWLLEAGWTAIEVLDITATTPAEQRSTPWMRFESLSDFLDPGDPTLTVEGHPAPVRAALKARKPACSGRLDWTA